MPLKIKISKEITIPTSIVSKRMWEGELEQMLRQLKSHLSNHEDAILDEMEDISESIVKADWVETDEDDEEEDSWDDDPEEENSWDEE